MLRTHHKLRPNQRLRTRQGLRLNRASRTMRLHKLCRVVVSACVVVVVALAVGVSALGSLGPEGPFNFSSLFGAVSADQNSKDDSASDAAFNTDTESSDAELADADSETELADASQASESYDPIYTPKPVVREEPGVAYRSSEVLITIDDDATPETINAAIAQYDFIDTKDVSNQDLSLGFVKVIVKDNVNVPEAADTLADDGLIANPNYVLQLLDQPTTQNQTTNQSQLSTQTQPPAQNQLTIEEPLVVQAQSEAQNLPTPQSFLNLQAHPADSISGYNIYTSELSNGNQWMLNSLDARNAWEIQKASAGKAGKVAVAVIDSGCRTTHADLVNNIRATYNSYYAYKSSLGKDPNDEAAVNDTIGHGTHVAGIIAADASNNVGVKGTSYDADLVIIKAMDDVGTIDMAYVTQAYTWLLEDDDRNGLSRAQEYNVRVVNISLGAPAKVDENNALYQKIEEAARKGILTVCAGGNNDNATPPYYNIPGDYKTCLEVINLTADTAAPHNDSGNIYQVSRHSSSNYNTGAETETSPYTKDISAPGTRIWSTAYNDDQAYTPKIGTSMASPATAGVAALVFANNPNLTAMQAKKLLETTATNLSGDKNTVWTQEYGYGEVDAYRALQVTSAQIANESLEFLLTDDLKLIFGDGTTMTMKEWNESATSNRDTWTWKSSDPSVASVDNTTGKVSAHKLGKTTLTAEYDALLNDNGTKTISITKEIEVTKLDLSRVAIRDEDPANPGYLKEDASAPWVYTGNQIVPTVGASYNNIQLLPAFDYTVSYQDNVNAGEATVTLTAKENSSYKGSKSIKFTIGPADINTATFEPIPTQAYTGHPVTCDPVITFNNKRLVKDTDYTLSYTNNTAIGTNGASVTATAAKDAAGNYTGNFTGTRTLNFSISAGIETATVSCIGANSQLTDGTPVYNYTGTALTPKLIVEQGGKTLVEGTDYTLAYKNNIYIGPAVIEIYGKGLYTGKKIVAFQIARRPLTSSSVTVEPVEYAYTGVHANPEFVVKCDGNVLTKDVDYTVSLPVSCTEPGSYEAKIFGKGNMSGSISASFTVVKRSIGDAVVEFERQTYTGNALMPVPTVSVPVSATGVLKLQKGVDYDIAYSNNTAAGTATATLTGKGAHFTGTKTATFQIVPTLANASLSVSPQEYTGNPLTPDVKVVINGYVLRKDVDYTLSYENNTAACSSGSTNSPCAIVTGINNYGGTRRAYFSINRADISKATISVGDQTYTGSAITPNPTVTYNGHTLVKGKDYTLLYSSNVNVGTATLQISGIGNFTGSQAKNFTIKKPADSGNQGGNTGNQGNQGGNSGGNQGGNSGGNSGGASGGNQGGSSGGNSGGNSSGGSTQTIIMYRLYNPNSGEHLYTSDVSERDYLDRIGWNYEGIAWKAPSSGTPVYRLYNPNSGDHHYTTDASERDYLDRIGWNYEGIGWYSGGSIPLYRLFNPNETIGTHHYTTDVSERDHLDRIGWNYEGIGWYGM